MAKAPLPDEDQLRLRAFQRQVDKLRESKVVQQQKLQVTFSTNFDLKSGVVSTTVQGYDPESFRAALPYLRQFLLQHDDVQFGRIHNIINRHCEREELMGWTRLAYARWNEKLAQLPKALHVHMHGAELSIKASIEKVFYGYGGLFHVNINDPEEDKSVQAIQDGHLQLAFPHLFWSLNVFDSVIHWWLDATKDQVPPLPGAKESPSK